MCAQDHSGANSRTHGRTQFIHSCSFATATPLTCIVSLDMQQPIVINTILLVFFAAEVNFFQGVGRLVGWL